MPATRHRRSRRPPTSPRRRPTWSPSSGTTTTTNFAFTPMTANVNPDSKPNPLVGSTDKIGDTAAVDPAGRPMFPALFITDLTIKGPNSLAGDWQYGGTAIPPNFIAGTW